MNTRRRRAKPRKLEISFETMLKVVPELKKFHDLWTGQGYRFQSGSLRRCKDGTFSGRFVWRNRDQIASNFVYTVRGVVIS